MSQDFTTDVAGWFFLAGALMLWGGWVRCSQRHQAVSLCVYSQ